MYITPIETCRAVGSAYTTLSPSPTLSPAARVILVLQPTVPALSTNVCRLISIFYVPNFVASLKLRFVFYILSPFRFAFLFRARISSAVFVCVRVSVCRASDETRFALLSPRATLHSALAARTPPLKPINSSVSC